jgi:thiamine-monophosphate kinase
MYSEQYLIERITAKIPSEKWLPRAISAKNGLIAGIGDDAAVLAGHGEKHWIVTCDAFLESAHFLSNATPADSAGYKSLARATSDIAAMGAIPRFFFLTLAIPAARTGKWFEQFLQGMARAARELGLRLAGGDTTQFSSVAISLTVFGEAPHGRTIPRSGALPGDLLYVSGPLGRAEFGLRLLQSGLALSSSHRALLRPHLYPRIRVELGSWLARNRVASAMMDISDGLSTSLSLLCTASRVGARIEAVRIPTARIPKSSAIARLKLDPLQMALHGGDDYELLFTISPLNRAKLARAPGFSQLAQIGEITRDKHILLLDSNGSAHPLRPMGWDPFVQSKGK